MQEKRYRKTKTSILADGTIKTYQTSGKYWVKIKPPPPTEEQLAHARHLDELKVPRKYIAAELGVTPFILNKLIGPRTPRPRRCRRTHVRPVHADPTIDTSEIKKVY